MNLTGKVCLVVGASAGIGREVALRLGKDGATVICAARRKHLLESLTNEIGKNGHPLCMDVRNHSEVEASINQVLGEFGRIDVLVYCAGMFTYSLVKNKFFDIWKDMIATNCQGLVDVVSIILADMLQKDLAGHIIVMSSDAGRAPFPGLSVYSGTKFFTEGFLRSLRLECKDSKIRITSIQPGDVATPGQQWTTDTMAAELYNPLCRPPAESEKAWAAMLKPEDVAKAVIYALSQPEGVSINEVLLQPTGKPC